MERLALEMMRNRPELLVVITVAYTLGVYRIQECLQEPVGRVCVKHVLNVYKRKRDNRIFLL